METNIYNNLNEYINEYLNTINADNITDIVSAADFFGLTDLILLIKKKIINIIENNNIDKIRNILNINDPNDNIFIETSLSTIRSIFDILLLLSQMVLIVLLQYDTSFLLCSLAYDKKSSLVE